MLVVVLVLVSVEVFQAKGGLQSEGLHAEFSAALCKRSFDSFVQVRTLDRKSCSCCILSAVCSAT